MRDSRECTHEEVAELVGFLRTKGSMVVNPQLEFVDEYKACCGENEHLRGDSYLGKMTSQEYGDLSMKAKTVCDMCWYDGEEPDGFSERHMPASVVFWRLAGDRKYGTYYLDVQSYLQKKADRRFVPSARDVERAYCVSSALGGEEHVVRNPLFRIGELERCGVRVFEEVGRGKALDECCRVSRDVFHHGRDLSVGELIFALLWEPDFGERSLGTM